jgi:hypothetical protein
MSKLVYSEEELMRSHDYVQPHVEAGQVLHGGFDEAGNYIPPRCLVRSPAIAAWTEALRQRGGDWLAADSSLLAGIRYPSRAQNKLLLQEGLDLTFWNTLTITGKIEARGRVLADLTFPDFQDLVVEDISGMGIGHLKRVCWSPTVSTRAASPTRGSEATTPCGLRCGISPLAKQAIPTRK